MSKSTKELIEEWEENKTYITPWPWKEQLEGGSGDRVIINRHKEPFLSDEIYDLRIPKTMNFIASAPNTINTMVEAIEEAAELLKYTQKALDTVHFSISATKTLQNTLFNWLKKHGFETK